VTEKALIHVVDDDDSLRAALLDLLDAAGFAARGYASTGEFLLQPPADRPGCVLLDVRLPGPSGLDLQAALQRHAVALPVVFLTGHADVPTSVRAMKAGAVDFLEKPVERDTLLEALERALARDAAQRKAQVGTSAIGQASGARRPSPERSDMLLLGEWRRFSHRALLLQGDEILFAHPGSDDLHRPPCRSGRGN